ncbi:MAG: polysaccharide deacetylase family protein [Oscillospiraceae bacterium]|nr:polysaccharide deacetylase family protein [Oscillospiraceae bacterium]
MKTRVQIVLTLLLSAVMVLLYAMPVKTQERTYQLPVLMYHHFDENVTADTVVSPARFREQMTALKDAGYITVTLSQIIDFVDHGVPLPEKAVLITMDDGYTSNLTIAAPILEELGMCATVFVIGIYEGEEISPNSGNQLYPARLSCEDAAQWVKRGVLDIQSHTYNMHQRYADGFSGRDGILPMESEEDAGYRAALLEDARMFADRRARYEIKTELLALAYPYGFFDSAADEVLHETGFRVTFTVMEHSNLLRVGDESCLWNMGRFNVTERDSGERLLTRLRSA